MLTKAYSSSVV